MSSLRPRGTASASMSVTKPYLYSRLASSWIVFVAVAVMGSSPLGITEFVIGDFIDRAYGRRVLNAFRRH